MLPMNQTKNKTPALSRLGDGAAEDFESGPPEKFVPSGIATLDALILGAVAGEMLMIAGAPGQGKTSLAMQWAITAAQGGIPAAIQSLEMGRRALRNRLISSLTGLPMSMLRTREWPGAKQKKLAIEAAEYLSQIPLYVDDRSGLDGQQVYDSVMAWKQQGIQLGVVDYIQRMGGISESRVQQVGEAVRFLKNGAKDADIPLIVLSSLNRSGGNGDVPKMAHLRDSGDLEFETDTLLMFHYPEDDLMDDIRVCDIHVMKQRNGPTGIAEALFNKPQTRFEAR